MLHAPDAPLPVARVEELLAEARGAPEVHLQAGVAAVGEPLDIGAEPPVVAPPRAAVDVEDEGQVVGLDARRERQVGHQLVAVPGFDDDRLHRGQAGILEVRLADE